MTTEEYSAKFAAAVNALRDGQDANGAILAIYNQVGREAWLAHERKLQDVYFTTVRAIDDEYFLRNPL